MKHGLLLVLWILTVLAAMVCLICDYVISEELEWSLIVTLSLLVFGLVSTVILRANHLLRSSLLGITIIILPFLYLLSILLREGLVFSLGGSIAVVSCLFLWGAYGVHSRYPMQKYRMLSNILLLTIPLVFSIMYSCMYFLDHFTVDLHSSMYHLLAMVLLSVVFWFIDFAKSKTV